ncbi:MAG: CoA pyrophosphatase [Elusimicrobia bacterium]|nr:CoA pyrophosphatase [Elusimicrobiota bacterium]
MDIQAVRRALRRRTPVGLSEPGARQAAVALVLVPGPRGAEGLFIRRARHPADPWSGQIGLPGGRREAADPHLFYTAVRETAEETGVALGRAKLLGRLDDLHPRSRTLPSIVVRPFVFALEARPRLSLSGEVAYPIWLPLARLRSGQGTARPVARGRRLLVPCYRSGRHMVWGMTHRILTGLLGPVTFPG